VGPVRRPAAADDAGHENAGEVVATGDAVTTVTEGDQVICHPQATCGVCRPCRQGEDMYCEAINDVVARVEAAKIEGRTVITPP